MTENLFDLRVRRVEGAPVVALRALFRGGARSESKPGEALLAGRLLAEGSASRDFRRIAEEAESLGMIVTSFGGAEATGVAIDALAADWERALEWTAELLFEPAFPEDRFAHLVRQARAELEAQRDQAEIATALAFNAQLWAPHPRGRPLQGDETTLSDLRAADCRRFHRDSIAWGGVVSVAGPIDEAPVRLRLERFFDRPGSVPVAPPEPPSPPSPPPSPSPNARGEPRREIRTRAHDQAHLFCGRLTVPRAHADFAALELLGVVLGAGAGLTGRIPRRVRETEGLAYVASAETVGAAGIDPGRVSVYVATSPATVERAERAVREEIERVVAEGISDAEVEEAKGFLVGREPFRHETARQVADLAAIASILRYPIDDRAATIACVEALDRAEVEAAARRHVDPAGFRTTVGLPGA